MWHSFCFKNSVHEISPNFMAHCIMFILEGYFFWVWPGFRILESTAETMQALRVKMNKCVLCHCAVFEWLSHI